MIRAKAYVRRGKLVLEVDGHALQGRDGTSIPCAAVSTVVQMTLAGLQAVQVQYPDHIALDIDYKNEDDKQDN